MITLPCTVIFSTPILIAINESSKGEAPWWVFLFAVVTGFSLSWLYWGVMVTYWRILTYSKVKNVPELKKKAINAFLIWPDKHWLIHAEFRTNLQRKRLRNIDRQLFVRHRSKTTPIDPQIDTSDDVKIYYKSEINYIELIFSIMIFISGLVLLYIQEIYLAFIFVLFGLIGSIYELRQISDRNAQIDINANGIETNASGFVPWSQIVDTKFEEIRRGKRINKYFVFNHKEATNPNLIHEDKIELTELEINPEQVEMLVEKHLANRLNS